MKYTNIIFIFFFSTALINPSATYAADSIYEAQVELSKRGYETGTPDGIYGRKTASALREFQSDNGLVITGELDETTATILNIVLPGVKKQQLSQDNHSIGEPSASETIRFIKSQFREDCPGFFGESEVEQLASGARKWIDNIYEPSLYMDSETLTYKVKLTEQHKTYYSKSGTTNSVLAITKGTYNVRYQELSPEVTLDDDFSNNIILRCSTSSCAQLATWWSVKAIDLDEKTGKKKKSLTKFKIPFCDTDTAQRVSKAFHHLIMMTGGKKSLF